MAFWKKRYISKYTGKEIDEAVGKAADSFENPMTAAGDLIVGGTDGAAEKLAKGTAGQALKVKDDGTGIEWGAVGKTYTAGTGIDITNDAISVSGLPFSTTAPTEANTDGTLHVVVLSAEPATKYNGYLYIIT